LEPIDPETALDMHFADRGSDITDATHYSDKSRLGPFVRWRAEQGIENLNDQTGRQLDEYRRWRRNEGDISPVTEKTPTDTLRGFIRWPGSIDGVPETRVRKCARQTSRQSSTHAGVSGGISGSRESERVSSSRRRPHEAAGISE